MVLFNQKNTFYLKHGFPNVIHPASFFLFFFINYFHSQYPKKENTSPQPVQEDLSWINLLSAGDCIDGKRPDGDWEIVIIDEMSPVGTEINVTWSTGRILNL